MHLRNVLAVLVSVSALGFGQARGELIVDLIASDGSLTIGDKVFSDFSITAPAGFDAGQVTVTTIGTGAPEDLFGLRFGGPFVAVDGEVLDVQLGYSVATTGGQAIISDIHQAFNLTAQGTGGNVAIGETAFDAPAGNLVAQSSVGFVLGVQDANDPPGELVQGDQLLIDPPLSQVWVTKDIFLAANDGGLVGATILEQRFSQVAVPEPATLLLVGGGVAAMGLLRRRRA